MSSYKGNDSPVIKAGRLYSSANDHNEIGEDDGTLTPYPLSKDESHNSSKRASDIVDRCYQPSHRRVGVAECVFEALTAQYTSEETLIILMED